VLRCHHLPILTFMGMSLWTVSAAASSEVVLGTEPFGHESKVSVLGGNVVWSSYDAATKRSRLMHWSNGVTRALPVASRKGQFDPDLGLDRNGRIVVTYSRCRTESVTGGQPWPWRALRHGCRPYELALDGGREHPLGPKPPRGRSWTLPSRWRDKLVFFESPLGHSRGAVRWLRMSSHRRARALPRGMRSFGTPAGPTAIDVRGLRVAYDWTAARPHCRDAPGDGRGDESLDVLSGWLRLPVELAGGPGPVGLTELTCTSDPVKRAVSPSLDAAGLSYVVEGPWNGTIPVVRTRTTAGRIVDTPIDRVDGEVTSASADGNLVVASRVARGDMFAWDIVLMDRSDP
jgi:hypothetical protein